MAPNKQKITIVGAGLVGSLLALLLRKRDFPVDLFERRSDPRLAQAGGGRSINLVITSRGLYGLEQAGLLTQLDNLAVPVYGRMIHSKDGDLAYQAYGQEDEYNLSISRDRLNNFLLEQAEVAGARVHFNCELQALDPEKRVLRFKTASPSVNADFDTSYQTLFAADGAGSKVRKELAKISAASFTETTDWLEADYKELVLPLGEDGKAQLRTDALHIWPRGDHMMMALANHDGSFTTTIYLPKAAFARLNSPQEIKRLFETEFADAIPLMKNYVAEMLGHPQGVLGTVHTSRWVFNDSVALIGDAAHAIVPFFGQGMNCGFEDCTTLMQLLDTSGDWPTILNTYEKERKPNAAAIAEMALENWVEMRDKVGDKKFLLRKKVEAQLEQKFPAIYKSRYGLITYTLTPYALAQKAGELQERLLATLIGDKQNIEEIDWEAAQTFLLKEWAPFVRTHQLTLEKYRPSKRL